MGRRLFEGVSEAMVMNAIDKLDAPAPSQMTPRYSPDLERIVMKGLARDRDRRYQSADELRGDLEAFARAQRLDVSPRAVATFVRSVQADSQAADSTLTPSPVQREFERALRSAQTPRTPKAAVTDVTPAIVVRSFKRVVWFATLGLMAGAGVGVGAAWYARHRASAPAPVPAAAAPATAAHHRSRSRPRGHRFHRRRPRRRPSRSRRPSWSRRRCTPAATSRPHPPSPLASARASTRSIPGSGGATGPRRPSCRGGEWRSRGRCCATRRSPASPSR